MKEVSILASAEHCVRFLYARFSVSLSYSYHRLYLLETIFSMAVSQHAKANPVVFLPPKKKKKEKAYDDLKHKNILEDNKCCLLSVCLT